MELINPWNSTVQGQMLQTTENQGYGYGASKKGRIFEKGGIYTDLMAP